MLRFLIPFLALVLFMGYTVFAIATSEQSLGQFASELMSRPTSALVVFDVYLALLMIATWMFFDARKRGHGPGYLSLFYLITFCFGSAGPLAYLTLRGWHDYRRTRR
ncbi:MAG: DUF2834 domain-containing protein [Salinicola sp.]|uniref:DUF2834 domain-containing protein n=1 Tax=Salinicola sp. TaxID=1978524 RepID=UPI000C93C502|nr:DUF2834 domain-containing protein [Salinicola sp.]MAM58429.1 DUF2834 domain-containing protein [Salinicola sp.]NRB54840.1 DUF2834 domain-containing protein [Salinicola sp.]